MTKQLAGGIHRIFNDDVWSVRRYSSINIDWHVSHDHGDVVAFIVHYILWLVLAPFVCNFDIMIFTDAPVEIGCS